MKIEVTKRDLKSMVRGMSPPRGRAMRKYEKYGSYSGGFNDSWSWNYNAFENLSEQELFHIYQTLKSDCDEAK